VTSPGEAHPVSALSDLDPVALRSYTRKKQALAQLVHQVADVLRRAGNESHAAVAHELLVKLAEDRFTLAVVGQFKRGKSSLINAIVGREILPTGVLPLTSAITILRYGARERLIVHFTGFHLTQEAALTALPEFVTQDGNPSNHKRVQAVYVELPVRFLRRGLEFVDTPGIGSAIEANTVTTCNFIPRCDAVLFVTSVEAPLTAVETEFLRTVRQHVRKIFFVLNKIDLLDERELGQVTDYARRSLEELTGTADLKLYAVSSRHALQAGRESTASGLPALQDALARFLATESATTFLSSIVDKTRCLCADARARVEATTAAGLVTLDQRLAKLSGLGTSSNEEPAQTVVSATEFVEKTPVEAEAPSVGDVDLIAALHTRGCPVCDHVEQVAFEFFRHFQYGLVNHERVQRQFAEQHGFCPLHIWQLAGLMSPQGLSDGLPPLVERVAVEISGAASSRGATSRGWTEWTVNTDRCQVCLLLRKAETDFTARLGRFVGTQVGQDAYARSQGVCLRHLDGLLGSVPTDALRTFLLNEAARRFGELAEDLRAYALKREALRSGLATGDEEDAHRRALVHIVGDKRVCLP
jgi:ribosome biogenesis GTPase A